MFCANIAMTFWSELEGSRNSVRPISSVIPLLQKRL